MNLLALDLASVTGWASAIGDQRESGVVNCNHTHAADARGWRYIRFNFWLHQNWREKRLDLVVYEKPIPIHASFNSAEIAFGLSTRVQEFCARLNLRGEAVNNRSVKAFAGNGNAGKEYMVRTAQVLKKGVTDHNEADALWLLEYAMATFVREEKAS